MKASKKKAWERALEVLGELYVRDGMELSVDDGKFVVERIGDRYAVVRSWTIQATPSLLSDEDMETVEDLARFLEV